LLRAILQSTMYVHPSREQNTKIEAVKAPKQHETTVSNKNRYVIGFIIGLLLFIPTFLIAHTHHLTGLQARLFYDFDHLPNGFRVPALIITEALGSAIPIAICVLIPIFYKRYRLAWRFAFTAGGASAVAEVAKLLTKEPRPVAMLHGALTQRAVETGPGFPSGHETAAAALALTLWLILPKQWRWLSIAWILIVAVSRLYLGVHTPADVIGGFAIGLMSVCFVQLLPHTVANRIYLFSETNLLKKGK
jgi:membrane-associated phospholipid phosphatase